MNNAKRPLEQRFLVAYAVIVLLVLILVVGAAYKNASDVLDVERSIDHTYAVLYELSKKPFSGSKADTNLQQNIEIQERSINQQIQRSIKEESEARICFILLGVLLLYLYAFVVHRIYVYVRDKQERIAEAERLNREITVARDEARAASKLKSEFLANISHELRTPLNGMIGATEVVLMTPLTEEQSDLIATAKNCCDSLLTLVDDILDFASIEAHKFELKPAAFGLVDSIDAALEPFKIKAHNKGLKFIVVCDEGIPKFVVGDFPRLCQALLNLVDNAIKFTEQGSVTIQLSLFSEDSEKVSVCFRVSDTGIGISSDCLDIIFDRFAQADGSMKRKYGGVGLGLSISKSIIEIMSGTIDVSSQAGHGSKFTVIIPFAKATQSEQVLV